MQLSITFSFPGPAVAALSARPGVGRQIREFLLVPYFGACIHYPPPPPNQTVYVRLEKPFELESMWEPVWVTGTIETDSFTSELAEAGYTLLGTNIEAYLY